MKRNKHIGTFGTVIHGTMREEDLIPAFASELRSLARKGTKHKALLSLQAIATRADRSLCRFPMLGRWQGLGAVTKFRRTV